MPQFARQSEHFLINGIDLNHPADQLPDGKWPILENVRSDQAGRLLPRSGMKMQLAIAGSNVHSLIRMPDPIPGVPYPVSRVIGVDTSAWVAPLSGSLLGPDTGYSGNPLSLVPYRPDQSPEPWCYIYDSQRQRKVRSDGTFQKIGIAPPAVAPTLNMEAPKWNWIDNQATNPTYTFGGNATSGGTYNPAVNVPFYVNYDNGANGWGTFAPYEGYDLSFMGELRFCLLNNIDWAQMVDIHPKLAGTTVLGIAYDSGTSGLCTVQPAGSWTGLRTDAMVFLGATHVRVLSVTISPDGSYSFRCSIPTQIIPGASITYPACFRGYTNGTRLDGELISQYGVKATLTGIGEGTVSVAQAVDLSSLGGRATQREDYIHISILVDKLENVIQGKLMFDVDSTTNDFTQNYYFKSFRANDFVPVTVNDATVEAARAVAIQRQITDLAQSNNNNFPSNPAPTSFVGSSGRRQSLVLTSHPRHRTDGPWVPPPAVSTPPDGYLASPPDLSGVTSNQTTTGSLQWTELIFKFSDLIRVGSDFSRTLANVKAWRLSLIVTDTVNISLAGSNYTGTYGPDQGVDQNPLLYRFRYRSSLTGAHSRPGPATRAGVLARRNQVNVTVTPSSAPEVDQIDIERFGGTLSDWHFVGSLNNISGTFIDTLDDLAASQNDALDINAYQPWPSIDIPRSMGVLTCGTTVIRTTGPDAFNPLWAAGTPIRIDGTVFTLYAPPKDDAHLELVESANYRNASMRVDEPVLTAQNAPFVWGPSNGMFFSCGHKLQPGIVRFTIPNDPDSAPEQYWIELTSPSEPLINGVLYDGRSFVASNSRWFDLKFTGDVNSPVTYQELTVDRGVISPWAMCTGGGRVWFLSHDGIYWTTGGPATNITFKDLRPLFPHGGAKGIAINGFNPPDLTAINFLRLSWAASWLYFDYKDSLGNLRTLAYNTDLDEWWPDYYTPGVLLHYGEETGSQPSTILCGGDGRVYSYEGVGDASNSLTPITCHARTSCKNYDDIRSFKLFGDLYLDANTNNTSITVTPGFDTYTDLLPSFVYNTPSRLESSFDLLSGLGKLSRDIALDFTWSTATNAPAIYNWGTSLVDKPENTLKRATDWDDSGTSKNKYIRAILIHANTHGTSRTVSILKDQGVDSGSLITVNHATQAIQTYSLTPFTSHLVRVYPNDAANWEFFGFSLIYDEYPETGNLGGMNGGGILGAYSDLGYKGDKWIQGVRLRADTSGAAVPVQIQGDYGTMRVTITTPTTNGQAIQPYSWQPFVSHLVRIAPQAPGAFWDPPDSEFIWEPMPELTTNWQTQPTTHDNHGWSLIGWFYLAYMSLGAFTFQIITESGQSANWSIPSSGGDLHYRKLYFIEAAFTSGTWPLKGRSFTYNIIATPAAAARIFQKDCEVAIKQWGSDQAFEIKNPFGDASRAIGARI